MQPLYEFDQSDKTIISPLIYLTEIVPFKYSGLHQHYSI